MSENKSTELTNYADKAMFEAEPMDSGQSMMPRVYLLNATC